MVVHKPMGDDAMDAHLAFLIALQAHLEHLQHHETPSLVII